jgi:hypothetical protein
LLEQQGLLGHLALVLPEQLVLLVQLEQLEQPGHLALHQVQEQLG